MRFRFSFDYGQWVSKKKIKQIENIVGESISLEKEKVAVDGSVDFDELDEDEREDVETEKVPKTDGDGKFQPKSYSEYSGDIRAIFRTAPDVDLEVHGFDKQEALGVISDLAEKIESFEDRIAEEEPVILNDKTDVEVPDNPLLEVEFVTWREDCCTEELQDDLDNGWRILAICPQPDQRRPDYVLGRNDQP